jgi:F0F1-type ATP synthase membrane subunit b/b'
MLCFWRVVVFFVLFCTVAYPVAPPPRSVLHRRGLSLRTARRRLGSLREDLFEALLLLLMMMIVVVT